MSFSISADPFRMNVFVANKTFPDQGIVEGYWINSGDNTLTTAKTIAANLITKRKALMTSYGLIVGYRVFDAGSSNLYRGNGYLNKDVVAGGLTPSTATNIEQMPLSDRLLVRLQNTSNGAFEDMFLGNVPQYIVQIGGSVVTDAAFDSAWSDFKDYLVANCNIVCKRGPAAGTPTAYTVDVATYYSSLRRRSAGRKFPVIFHQTAER